MQTRCDAKSCRVQFHSTMRLSFELICIKRNCQFKFLMMRSFDDLYLYE